MMEGIAVTIKTLMVKGCPRTHLGQATNSLQDMEGVIRMGLDDAPFLGCQFARLVKELSWNRQFAES